METPLK